MTYKIYIFLISAVIFVSCKDDPVNPLEYGEGEDYKIYEKVFSDRYTPSNHLIILGDSTESGLFYSDSTFVRYILEQIPDLTEETFDNYININQQKVKLSHIPNAKNIIFGSEFPGKSDSLPHLTISRIGYDKSRTQALLTIGEIFGPLAGSGHLIFLTKKEEGWVITKVVMTWIS